ncbi:MAG: phytanoyl-CoA dioxygenase family protein [Candidatus Kapaibacterium sp.]|jgi:ectoine hydroxylase-related dioxygenase (phytanoyl-CoA dioxygenase family)
MHDESTLAGSEEVGTLGILHLKRYWSITKAKRDGRLRADAFVDEWSLDTTLLSALGLGLEPTLLFLYREAPTFEAFEEWIRATTNVDLRTREIAKFNDLIQHTPSSALVVHADEILTEADLQFWNENGYVVIHNAVTPEEALAAEQAVWDHLEMDKHDPQTWYKKHPSQQGIMVQLFRHQALEATRRSEKIRRAYEQIWNRTDLWVSTDRVSFNPPENEQWSFPGPRLHWDVRLELPIPFNTQGLLYLADTAPDQGAFTLVPGFQHRIESWMNSLPKGVTPQLQDLYALGHKPIGGKAGDFILWHQALPHASSPNTSTRPRIVQYINWKPQSFEIE